MKSVLLSSTVLTLLFFTSAYGKKQEYRHSKPTQDTGQMKFGITPKLNIATISADDESMQKTIGHVVMPSFDLFGEYALNDTVGVQLSLGYSGQGSAVGGKGGADKIKMDIYLHYIMLSAMPRFYPGSDRQFCLFVGPRISWLASAKRQRFVNGKKVGKEIDFLGDKVLEKNKPKRVDWGVLFGLDYESDAGIILGVDWNIGITNILKDESNKLRTFSTGLTLGYNFAKLFN